MTHPILFVVKYHDTPESDHPGSTLTKPVKRAGLYKGRGGGYTENLQRAEVFGWKSWQVDKYREASNCDVIPVKLVEVEK